jgi:hypothetical protein
MRGSTDLEATWESKLTVSRDELSVCSVTAEHREAEASGTIRYRLDFEPDTESVRLEPVEAEPELVKALLEALEDGRGLSLTELAVAAGKRRSTVEQVLTSDARFARADPPPGMKHNAKCWTLSELARPGSGTSTDGQTRDVGASACPGTPHTPEGGGVPDGQTPSLPVSSSEQAERLVIVGDPDFLNALRRRRQHVTDEEWRERRAWHKLVERAKSAEKRKAA